MKQKQWKSEEDNKTVVHRQPILDFGEEPVKNLDAKLEILKFNYSWVDEVEREERMTEEAKWKALEPTDVMKQKQWPSDDNNRSIYGQAFLDFGEEPVTNLDVKLDILKFNYSWATEVEEHERRTKEAQLQSKDQEDATEKEIQKSVPIEEVKVKIPEKPQKVTPEDQAREMTKVQNAKEEVQEKTNNGLSH
ncbi:uncharacterized protein LOC133184493 [Saccostrea echinata]|uniref:uncharacterized protein LOC133184493 n=1 Tax=Saccostrea echinata TaxID=191078 RepID=UPI002A80EA01|nr:uncharacterized protein LOC133184493 [Saccostrea echinata]